MSSDAGSEETLADHQPMTDNDKVTGSSEKASAPSGPPQPPANPNIVQFSGSDDPDNPQNWSFRTKILQTALLGLSTLVVTFASSVFAYSTEDVAEVFNVSIEVSTLGTSLFLLGYVVGPPFWGPTSEFLGRRNPLLLSYLAFTVFNIGPAVADNLQTIMICRFLCGFAAIGAPSIVGGSMVDMWNAQARGVAIVSFCMFVIGGPALGPIIGAFISESYLGWRWTSFITLIWAGFMLALLVIFLKESFVPVILQKKARDLRYETGNWALHSQLDEKRFSLRETTNVYILRPFIMLAREPILLISTIYVSFIYGLVFGLFEAVPYVFQELRGFGAGPGGLVFISFLIGAFIAGGVFIAFVGRYNRVLAERKTISAPDERTYPMMIGAVAFPIGLFLFGWTAPRYVSSAWPEIVAIGIVGFAFVLIFLGAFLMIIDCYLMVANSAIAAQTIMRSLFAAAFPLFATQMYANLGTQWASTLLALIGVVLLPFPFVFRLFCDRLVQKSHYIPDMVKRQQLSGKKGEA